MTLDLRPTIAITDLSAEIAARTGAPPQGGHRKFQQLAVDARLPGAHRVNGRWHVYLECVPAIMAVLGLTRGSRSSSDGR